MPIRRAMHYTKSMMNAADKQIGRLVLERGLASREALQQAGGNVRLTVYPDADHDSWTRTYEDPELYAWLLRQRRTP